MLVELAPFVPRLAIELDLAPGPRWVPIDGSMLSADISGFTALSEKLAGKGKAGAEEITEIVNACFTALIDAAYDYGGEVLKFGGDALLILFRGDDHQRRAVDGGLSMQDALASSPSARRAGLTMTVGIAEGPFDVFLVGSGYREMLVTGRRANEVIALEGAADKGDTVVSATIAEALPDSMLVREHADGWVVSGRTGVEPPGPAVREISDRALERYVPSQVSDQLSAFSGAGGEHRLVTVGFLMLTGLGASFAERGSEDTAVALHDVVDSILAVCEEFGVTMLHTDIAPDGVKFVLCAGAPINHGDTGDGMLQAALRLSELETPFTLRQGVQTGRVFAGFLGSQERRTYTLMGDPVNTAARLLGRAADRDVVAMESVVEGTRTVFVTEPLEPFMVKGKSEPIVAHRVRAVSDEVRRDTAGTSLFGRRAELDVLTTAVAELGRVVEVCGPAGVGKSRLLDAAWDVAEGIDIFQAACTPYGRSSPYSVFRPLLRTGSGIDPDSGGAAAGAALTELVRRRAPQLLPMLPLLAVPFGADVPATPESDSIDASVRRARIHDVIVEFVDAILDGPILLVVEDVHWIDDASGDLLAHLVRTVEHRPWASILTRRPTGTWELPDVGHATRLDIGPLSPDDVRSMAIETSERPLGDEDLDAIVARAGGNALFAIELTRAVSRGTGSRLPDSIEEVIGTRIDELPPDQRHLIRVAAVYGRDFDLADVSTIADRVIESLPDELTEMVERLDGDGYRFRHAMYRDVAYEGLPFRSRQRLHGEVADHLESRAASPEAIAPVLSLHFSEARRRDAAWRYSCVAGDQAAAQYAHREAVTAYRRALDAADHLRAVSPDERLAVARRLGDASVAVGDYDHAFRTFGRARRLAKGVDAIDLMRRQGAVRDRQGKLSIARRWFTRCLAALPDSGGTERERTVRLDVHLAYAAVCHRQGHFEECLAWARRAAADATELGDRPSLARAYDRLHVAATYLGLPEAQEYGPRALELHRSLDDHLSQARILDNMGIQAYFAYEWDRAIEFYDDAAAAGRIAGDVIEANLGRANAAEVWSDRGRFELAIDEFADVLRNWSAAGWTFGEATARSNLALARARSGAFDPSVTTAELEAALSTFTDLGADEFITETRIRIAEAAVHLGDDELAIRTVARLLDSVEDKAAIARVERQWAMALMAAGDADQLASGPVQRSIAAADAAEARYELGLSMLVRAHLEDDDAARRVGALVLSELGVERLAASFRRLGIELLAPE